MKSGKGGSGHNEEEEKTRIDPVKVLLYIRLYLFAAFVHRLGEPDFTSTTTTPSLSIVPHCGYTPSWLAIITDP